MKKHTIGIVALLAALSLMTVSCQKEEMVDVRIVSQENSSTRTVLYTIDGVQYEETIYGEAEWQAFLDRMFALAEEGHSVSFRGAGATSNMVSAKEKVVFTTTDRAEAEQWADKMENQGYAVNIVFDENTGIYTCTAIK